jgi:hypothetical protein
VRKRGRRSPSGLRLTTAIFKLCGRNTKLLPARCYHAAIPLSLSFVSKDVSKDALCARSAADKEALLVHVVDVMRVNIVLWDFRVEELEILTMAILVVSFVAIAIQIGGPC